LIELNDGDADSDHPAGTWKRLLLAKSPEDPSQFLQFTAGTSPSGCEAPQSPFNVVSPLLSTTLMHDSLFLVVPQSRPSQPDPLGTFDSKIQLGEYTYEIFGEFPAGVVPDDNQLGSNAVLIFASLSFLGLGPEPSAPEWGRMAADGIDYFDQWWLSAFPGIAIFTVVMAFNFVGDGLRDLMDPRTRKTLL